jgi:hypothetical protein
MCDWIRNNFSHFIPSFLADLTGSFVGINLSDFTNQVRHSSSNSFNRTQTINNFSFTFQVSIQNSDNVFKFFRVFE